MPKKLSHFDGSGRANMVDVSSKTATGVKAEASAYVILKPAVLKALPKNPKGDALEVARLAGIMAVKRTADLIPMLSPAPLAHVDVSLRLCENGVAITSKVITTAVTEWKWKRWWPPAWPPLTVYDMCKALDKELNSPNRAQTVNLAKERRLHPSQ